MRPHNLTFDVGRTMRVAVVAIGMIALVVPNSDTASADDTKKGRRQGTSAADGKPAARLMRALAFSVSCSPAPDPASPAAV